MVIIEPLFVRFRCGYMNDLGFFSFLSLPPTFSFFLDFIIGLLGAAQRTLLFVDQLVVGCLAYGQIQLSAPSLLLSLLSI